jgi:hypothetical protein
MGERIGMFCRLGSVLDSRPVVVFVCKKVVWMYPSFISETSPAI